MNELQIFNHDSFGEVRTILKNNEPWFVLSDVCKVLEISNTADVKNRLEKDVVTIDTLDTNGGKQRMITINEDGLYDVILDSRKPEAKKFRKWVTSEVLPSIRKTGGYKLPGSYKEALLALVAAEEEKEKLTLENTEMKPKADYFDAIVERNLLLNFRDTAKELKIKQKEFITFLEGRKYIYRDKSNKVKPYMQYVPTLFELKEWANGNKAGSQTLITPKGRETFRLLLGTVGSRE